MKRAIVIAAMFAIMAGTVFAQSLPSISGTAAWESPQSQATAGRMRSAADDFIRPDSYTSAGVNDWFTMASFSTATGMNLGYAKKLENLYLAVYYGGTFWANLPSDDYTETYTTWRYYDDGIVSVPVYTNGITSVIGATRPNNRAAILIGVADMGFRLTFNSTYETFSKDDFISSTTQYKSYKTEAGVIAPQFAWSMAKNLTKKGIKPYVTFELIFNRAYTAEEVYDNNIFFGDGTQVTNSQNYLQPIAGAGLGGYTLASKDGFSVSADLDYVLRFRNYNDNRYSYEDFTGRYQTKKISGYVTGSTIQEKDYLQNEVTPSLSGSWNGDKLRLRVKLNLPVTITNEDTTNLGLRDLVFLNDADEEITIPTGELVKNGDDQRVTTVAFTPNLRLAARWQVASKLYLNAGGRVNIPSITYTTTDSEKYQMGLNVYHKNTNRFQTVWGTESNSLWLGLTNNATDHVMFEVSTGAINTGNTQVFTFGSILVSLKF